MVFFLSTLLRILEFSHLLILYRSVCLLYSELVIDGGMLTEHDTLWLVPAEIKLRSSLWKT